MSLKFGSIFTYITSGTAQLSSYKNVLNCNMKCNKGLPLFSLFSYSVISVKKAKIQIKGEERERIFRAI